MPIVKLFYEENGLENFELFYLHGAYSLIIAVIEVPSGYLADRWGRKNSILIGTFMGLVGFGIYSKTAGAMGFLFAEIALGIGQAFLSGSDTALLYDTLESKKHENRYIKIEGRITATGNFAESAAGVVVTLLAVASYRQFYYMQTALSLLAFVGAFFLYEPAKKHSYNPEHQSFKLSLRHILFQNKALRYYVLQASFFGMASLSMAWFAQVFFYEIKLSERWYGIAWTSLNLIVALGSISSHYLQTRLNEKFIVPLFIAILGGAFLVMGLYPHPLSLSLLVLFYFFRGSVHPIMKNYINSNCSSEIRATVLSIRSFVIRVLFAAASPFLGYLADRNNVSTSLIITGLLVSVPAIIIHLKYQTRKK